MARSFGYRDIGGLWTTFAFHNLERYALVGEKCYFLVVDVRYACVVDKDVVAVLEFDEPEALGGVVPFYFAIELCVICHFFMFFIG